MDVLKLNESKMCFLICYSSFTLWTKVSNERCWLLMSQSRTKSEKKNNKSLFSSFFLVIPKGFMKTETLQPLYHFEVSQKTYTYEAESRLICIKQIYRFILLANRFILLANKRCSVPNAFLPIVGKPWKTNKKEFIY